MSEQRTEITAVRLKPAEAERLRALADREERTRSDVLRRAFRAYLRSVEPAGRKP